MKSRDKEIELLAEIYEDYDDEQLQAIMQDMVRRIKAAQEQGKGFTPEQEEKIILITTLLSELVFSYAKKFYIDSKLMPLMREYFTERWQVGELEQHNWYNYNKLTILLKFENRK